MSEYAKSSMDTHCIDANFLNRTGKLAFCMLDSVCP
uniref:Uncharacterized protein n=1 Tax=Nelumbo nucifera TaxID=4432 RepID=A0A822ZT52_NELNU|nr:TPA_asm: hypothetical protein HUJ06_016668 [Nelumbo nucifera]